MQDCDMTMKDFRDQRGIPNNVLWISRQHPVELQVISRLHGVLYASGYFLKGGDGTQENICVRAPMMKAMASPQLFGLCQGAAVPPGVLKKFSRSEWLHIAH
eukprot:scaffold175654_cov27-Prasinocladus_malaysianus.AAC.1